MRFVAPWVSLIFSSALVACGPPREMPWDGGGTTDTPVATDVRDTVTPADTGGEHCNATADCDDHLACTTDLCLFDHSCQHTSTCTSGMFCTSTGCSATRTCTSNADCDDSIACTHDVCGVGGACQNVRDDSLCDTSTMQTCSVALGCIAMGRCGADADCDDARYCNGPERCVMSGSSGTCMAGTPIACDDMDSCTADQCNETTHMCDHMPLNPCGGTVESGTYNLSPAPSFSCGSGSIGPVSQIMMMVTASSVTVTGFPRTLTGGAPSMGMFSATGPSGFSCGGTITLSGSFTMPGMFQGSWSLSAGTCDITCNSHFDLVNGTIVR